MATLLDTDSLYEKHCIVFYFLYYEKINDPIQLIIYFGLFLFQLIQTTKSFESAVVRGQHIVKLTTFPSAPQILF